MLMTVEVNTVDQVSSTDLMGLPVVGGIG